MMLKTVKVRHAKMPMQMEVEPKKRMGQKSSGNIFGLWYGLMEGIGGILLFGHVWSTGGVFLDAMGIIYCICLYDCILKDYKMHVSQSLQQL